MARITKAHLEHSIRTRDLHIERLKEEIKNLEKKIEHTKEAFESVKNLNNHIDWIERTYNVASNKREEELKFYRALVEKLVGVGKAEQS